jgi:hypothetical protein
MLDANLNVVQKRTMSTERQSVTLTAPQATYLRQEAECLGISVSDLIRRIIDQYRLNEKRPP